MPYSYASRSKFRYGRNRPRSSLTSFRPARVPYRNNRFYSRRSGGSYRKGFSGRSGYISRGYSKPYRRTKYRSGRSGSGGQAVEQVVVRSVSRDEKQQVIPDSVGFDGLRGRVTALTLPDLVSSRLSDFNGRVNWVGVTCNTTYEIDSGGPFVHRRILFKSTILWPGSVLTPPSQNTTSGLRNGDYIRGTATDLGDPKLVGCLRRLFAQDTVRGVVQGPTNSLGVTVLKDETFNLRGMEDGVRRQKKYWNPFKSEPIMQYNLQQDGVYDVSLANSPQSQHLYLVDIFSYGLGGLDSTLPDPRMLSQVPPSGVNVDVSSQPPSKRMKSDDTVMSENSRGSFSVSDMKASLPNPMPESPKDGVASITTELKLYFRPA